MIFFNKNQRLGIIHFVCVIAMYMLLWYYRFGKKRLIILSFLHLAIEIESNVER